MFPLILVGVIVVRVTMKKRVAIITNIPSPYRVGQFINLQNKILEYEFFFIFSDIGDKERSWDVKLEGLRNAVFLNSKPLMLKSKSEVRGYYLSLDVIKTLNSISPDVVIVCEYNMISIQAFLYCKIQKIKVISMTDGTLYSERNFGFFRRLNRRMMIPRADMCIASSTKSKELQIYYGAKEDRIIVAYLTVDVGYFRFEREEYHSHKLLFIGSLIERKGIDLLLKALSLVKKDYTLTIVGDGEEKSRLVDYVEQNGMKKLVEFVPFKQKEELREIYNTHDIFILPTREDCFGLVISEAMAASMPVISSCYADGAYDLVIDGENGYIVNPYDSVEFANTIEKLIANDELVEKMGKASFEIINKFSFDKTSEAIGEAINRVLDK